MSFCAGSGLFGHESAKRVDGAVLPLMSASKPKSVEERLAEAEAFRGKLSSKRVRDIKRHILNSAMDFGELGQVVEVPPANHPKAVSLAEIQCAVAAHFGITPDNILSQKASTIIRARQVAAYLARTLTRLSFNQVRQHFGGGHHTTVMYSVKAIEAAMKADGTFAAGVARLKEMLLS